MNSNNLRIILGVAIVIIIGLISYILWGDKPQIENDKQTTAEPAVRITTPKNEEVPKLKTYTNTDYNFKISYPADLPTQTGISGPNNSIFSLAINSVPVQGDRDGDPRYLYISVEPKKKSLECINDYQPSPAMTIGGIKAVTCNYPGSYFGEGVGLVAQVTRNNYTYTFTADFYDQNKAEIDKIISTFQFTK